METERELQQFCCVTFPKESSSSDMLAVGRLTTDDGIFPGKLKLFQQWSLRSCRNDATIIHDGREEYLAFGFTSCRYVWVPYRTLEQLPHGAVQGGHIDGADLFIARAYLLTDDGGITTNLGYYDPKRQLGYFKISGGCTVSNTMELMVLLWHLSFCYRYDIQFAFLFQTIQAVNVRTSMNDMSDFTITLHV